ncbi:asparagine synthase-related protein [Pseudobutyrivibrio xylanivorans]|uniref:asparagine synthase (glutamine-hydrolyzing) n=1 Tax=Pseudobutyrivibrio xylanivorans TaxID=185007 RepID=A0A5P6VUX6_PSEXY|nr:asparagine synthase-related protein [Pseudobutyrivibrio xylanivorans]QFJ56048.1 hypothetical protein FXF36_14735 [Pseudobutyrivibrio xylanivorans]
MSAIFGVIDLKKGEVNSKIGEKFAEKYRECAIDRLEYGIDNNVLMGCGIQYFNKEAEKEQLPYYDEKKDLFFTADCVIDNRFELIGQLGLPDDIPDGRIILEAYYKWGEACLEKLRGAFSFVIYSRKDNAVFMAVDQFAQRCLMYHVRDGVLYFSTLFFPMLDCTGLQFKENERWLVDTVSMRSPAMITEPRETAALDVFKVVSGTYVEFKLVASNCEIETRETRYFDPQNRIKTDWSITLEQSEEMARDTMTKSVSMILRDDIKISSQLSSGLDSSTVACIAAGKLAAKGEKLYTYTSIPLKEAGLPEKGYRVYNEQKGVEVICKAYPNIVPTFVDSKGRSYLTEVDDILDYWEMPCKSQQNAIWLDEIYKQASKNGVKIMLTGATGNTTISAGDFTNSAVFYAKKFRFLKALRMLDPLKNNNASRKKFIKGMFKSLVDYYKWYFDEDAKNVYRENVTRKDIGEKNNLTNRFRKKMMHYYPFTSMNKMREYMYMIDANSQIGEIDTKDSLKYGILLRDPIRNVEVVEMCLKLPMECFSSSDFDRRLVRVGMKGIVPKEIREDICHRGAQSGDNIYRANKVWPETKTIIKESIYTAHVLKYIDQSKVDTLIKSVDDGLDKGDGLLVSDIYSFSKYLKILEKKNVI